MKVETETKIKACFVLLQLNLWFPLTMVEGGSTAKLMVAAKDTFFGKFMYKDTTARNLAAVIYKVVDDACDYCTSDGISFGKKKKEFCLGYVNNFLIHFVN